MSQFMASVIIGLGIGFGVVLAIAILFFVLVIISSLGINHEDKNKED